jgi:hypothetical protein
LARNSSRSSATDFIRALSVLPPSAGMTVKMVAKTAMPTSSAMRKAGSVRDLTT